MPKERLDLMIESDVKSMLKIAALAQGVSMSQLVEDVLVDHLNAAGDPQSPSGAVADMLYIQQLQERLTAAIEAGLVMPLEAYDELCLHGDLSLVTAVPVIYLRDGDRPNQTDVILDNCVDADGNDVLTTYNDVTSTVTVRLHWNVSARRAGTRRPLGAAEGKDKWPRTSLQMALPQTLEGTFRGIASVMVGQTSRRMALTSIAFSSQSS